MTVKRIISVFYSKIGKNYDSISLSVRKQELDKKMLQNSMRLSIFLTDN